MNDMSRRKMLGLLGMAPFAGGVLKAAGVTHVGASELTLSEQARQAYPGATLAECSSDNA